jgi:predicted RNase H-like nuclease (RuvC/YqgF family)
LSPQVDSAVSAEYGRARHAQPSVEEPHHAVGVRAHPTDQMTIVGVMPMHTPAEAVAEIDGTVLETYARQQLNRS